MKAGLLKWYKTNKRDLPWRRTSDPYYVWLSEIILQQTRVDQGLSYYQRFVQTFPRIEKLAQAREEDVLKCWQGLGYYTRARNLHRTAQRVVDDYGGRFPDTYEGLLALPGIGPYTAAAIASIAFQRVHPVCDGNVERVVCRYLSLYGDPKTPAVRGHITSFLDEHIDAKQPGDFNQAMMELGALVCKPASADCGACPLQKHCKAFHEGCVDELPERKAKSPNPVRHFHYLIIRPKRKSLTWLHKRTGKDIWQGLYEFPLIETAGEMHDTALQKTAEWKRLLGTMKCSISTSGKTYIHHLSHRELRIRFLHVETDTTPDLPNDMEAVAWDRLRTYPVPVVIARYLQTLL